MSFFGVRFTTKEEREKKNLLWGNFKNPFAKEKKVKNIFWNLQDSTNLFDVMDCEELEAVERTIKDFHELPRVDFYLRNRDELGLQKYWTKFQFENEEPSQALNLLILRKLSCLKIFYCLNWEEEFHKELHLIVNSRLKDFYSRDFQIELEEVLPQKWINKHHLITQFIEEIDACLSTQGCRLGIFEVTDQEEYIGVFSEGSYRKYFEQEGGRETIYRLKSEE